MKKYLSLMLLCLSFVSADENVIVVTKCCQTFTVSPTPGFDSFWEIYPKWEKGTFKVFDRLVTSDDVVMDIGAWIGPTTLYLSRISRWV